MLQVGEISSNDKAKFKVSGEEIVLQFNPSEYEFSEEGRYNVKEENSNMVVQYLGSKPKTFNLTLNFDTSSIEQVNGTSREACSVKTKTDQIENLAKREDENHHPPEIEFSWGEISFQGFVTSVKTTFTLFSSAGIPLRAKVTVMMQQKPEEKKKSTPESPDRTKARVLTEDVSIWSLAQKEYGDMNEWRRIARANHILNPFEIEAGLVLEVPAIVDEE